MDKQDLEQIRQVVKEEFKTGFKTEFKPAFDAAFKPAFQESFAEVWQGNLEPAFDGIHGRIDVIETKLDKALYTEVVHLEARIKRLEEKAGITHQQK